MSDSTKRRWWKWLIAAGVLALAATVGVTTALTSSSDVDSSKVVTVERGDLARSVVAVGKVEPQSKIEVKSKASGIVERIHVDAGEKVRKGQVLIDLDKAELEARVREAEATLLAAEAAVEASRAVLARDEVEAQGPDLPFLKSAVQRAEELLNEGLGARAALETAEQAYQTALNRNLASRRNLAVSRAQVSRTEAEVAQTQAALDRAQEDLRNARILSPIDGVVLSRDVEIGDAVSSILVLGSQATLLMTLGDVDSVYVLGKVDEADIGKIYLGQPARISVESFRDKGFQGKVTKIAPLGQEVDNVTTFEVRVSIENPGGDLRANMSANAEIILEERLGVLLIPESAIRYGADSVSTVELPDSQSETGLRTTPVELGISNGVKTEVLAGLSEGDRIYQP